MDCFRQIYRLVKSPFTRNQHRVLEIGPPTNFRKEELPSFFVDDDATTLHSRTATEKDTIVKTTEEEPSRRDKIKSQVRRLSVKMSRPIIEAEEGGSSSGCDIQSTTHLAGENSNGSHN